MAEYRIIDSEKYVRRDHFKMFAAMANPYVGMTVNVDITDWLGRIKDKGYPFYLSLLYCVARAANRIPEFRQRILEDKIIEFDNCIPSYTVLREDGTYSYCNVPCDMPFEEYLLRARKIQEDALLNPSVEDGDDVLSLFFFSSIPWLSYTALVQPTPCPADSNPRITWGRYFEQNGRILLPLSVLCHHALVDGIHIAHFYDAVGHELEEINK